MSERLIVSIAVPHDQPDLLRVEDAFEQVLELFELAKASGEEGDPEVSWRLVSVTMNSPMTVTAEAFSTRPGVIVDAAARTQKQRLVSNLNAMKRGQVPQAWSKNSFTRNAASNFARRAACGTVETRVVSETREPGKAVEVELVDLSPIDSANLSRLILVEQPRPEPAYAPVSPKTQIGSVEGRFLDVGTHYSHPAIQIEERRSRRKVWCVVSDDQQREVADQAKFTDVWAGRRIVVSGRLEYDAAGHLHRVTASKIRLVGEGAAELQMDSDFTDGKSAADYLEDFREGNLG